jgi:hypothetical protein
VREWRPSRSYRDGVRSPRPAFASLTLASLLVAIGATSCANTKEEALPPAPPPVATTTSTTLVDYSTVPLAPVQSKTTTTVNQGPGHARLLGTVVGPDGPVPGATVRVERLQGASVVFRGDVGTDPEGKWQTGRVVGGRWRVRAWRGPDLADVRPETVFLSENQTKALTLPLDRFGAPFITAAIAPDPPPVSAPANLVIAVNSQSVDGDGIVHSSPVPLSVVQLFASNVLIEGDNPQFTDGAGRASWQVTCASAGPSGLFVSLQSGTLQSVPVAPCTEPAPPPTTPP